MWWCALPMKVFSMKPGIIALLRQAEKSFVKQNHKGTILSGYMMEHASLRGCETRAEAMQVNSNLDWSLLPPLLFLSFLFPTFLYSFGFIWLTFRDFLRPQFCGFSLPSMWAWDFQMVSHPMRVSCKVWDCWLVEVHHVVCQTGSKQS